MSAKKLFSLIGVLLLDCLIVAALAAIPSSADSLGDITVTLSDHAAGAIATHTVAFTAVNTIPKNGKIVIAFPPGFDISALSLGSNPNAFSLSISGQNVILNKTANVEIDAGTPLTIPLDNIVNNPIAGNSYYVTVSTTGPDIKNIVDGPSDSADFSIDMPSGVIITTASPLPDGQVGTPYLQVLDATEGTAPYTWSMVSGSLPSGLTLASTGQISGTPEVTGSFAISVQAVDSSSVPKSGTKGLTVGITAVVTPDVAIEDKTYDKTAAASISGRSLSGIIGTDEVILTGGSAAFASINTGNNIGVNVSGLTLSGASAPYYILSSTSATAKASILPRPLTVTAASDGKTYDGTTSSAALPTVTSGSLVAGDTAAWTQSFEGRDSGPNKRLIPTGTVDDGNGGANYSVTFVNADSGTINPRPLTLIGVAAADKVYDGNVSAAADFSGAVLAGVLPGDNVTLDASAAAGSFGDKNVAISKTVTVSGLSLSGADSTNYQIEGTPAASASITPRLLTVSAVGVDKVYDGTAAAMVTLSDDKLPGDILTVSYASASFPTQNAGIDLPVTVVGLNISGPDAGNYTLNSLAATASASIFKANPVISWAKPADITYPAPLSGVQLNATASIAGSFSYSPAAGTVLQAGKDQTLGVSFTPDDIINYYSASAEVKINVVARSGGGSGGGGGGDGGDSNGSAIIAPVVAGRTEISNYVNSQGIFLQNTPANSDDGFCSIIIPEGTSGKTGDGVALSYVTIEAFPPDWQTLAAPSSGTTIGRAYNLGPEGAEFDPPINITLLYDPALLSPEADVDQLVIGYWAISTQEWVVLEGSRADGVNYAVSAPLNHFSLYSILALPPATEALKPGQEMPLSGDVASGGLDGSLPVSSFAEPLGDFSDPQGPPGQLAVGPSGSENDRAEPLPASFDVGDVKVDPAVVEVGQDVLVAARVTNSGEASGDYEITLKINGIVAGTSQISLPGKSNQQISFRIRPDISGSYEIDVNGVKENLLVNAHLQAWYLIVLGLAGCLSFAIALTLGLWRSRIEGFHEA